MKNQYFGDIRDLFKYDVIKQILAESKILKHCFWIPMLTANDKTTQGEQRRHSKARAGYKNLKLKNFFEKYQKVPDKRNIGHLMRLDWFRKKVSLFSLDRQGELAMPDFFGHSRDQYFQKTGEKVTRPNSLIFLDPDTGIETSSTRGLRHIRLAEIKQLYSGMDLSSVLMIYQHHNRVPRPKFYRQITKKLLQHKNFQPLHISDNRIAFFFLVKRASLQADLKHTLQCYTKEYPKLQA